MLEDRVAKALAEKGFVAYEDVGRAQFARLQFADKALGLGESPHQIVLTSEQFIIPDVSDSSIGNAVRIVMPREPLQLIQEMHDVGRIPVHGADKFPAQFSLAINHVGLGPTRRTVHTGDLLIRIANRQKVYVPLL